MSGCFRFAPSQPRTMKTPLLLCLTALICTARAEPVKPAATPDPMQEIRVKCTMTMEDLRLLDGAIDQLALEEKLPAGTLVEPKRLILYVTSPNLSRNLAAVGGPVDRFGNPCGPFFVYKPTTVHPKTVAASKKAIGPHYKQFWGQHLGKE